MQARLEGMADTKGDSQMVMTFKMRSQAISLEIQMEWREVDGVAYVKNPQTGKWIIEDGESGARDLMGFENVFESETGLENARVRLDQHYSSLVYRLTGLLEDEPIDLWVDRKTHTILRMHREGLVPAEELGFILDGPGSGNVRVSIDIMFERFNEPVVVEKPKVEAPVSPVL